MRGNVFFAALCATGNVDRAEEVLMLYYYGTFECPPGCQGDCLDCLLSLLGYSRDEDVEDWGDLEDEEDWENWVASEEEEEGALEAEGDNLDEFDYLVEFEEEDPDGDWEDGDWEDEY